MVSSFALGYLMYKDEDSEYANKLLWHAKTAYKYAIVSPAKYPAQGVYQSSSGFIDDLAAASVCMYMATGDTGYLNNAENYYKQGVYISEWMFIPDNWSYLCLFYLAYTTKKPLYNDMIKNNLSQWWLNGTNKVRKIDGKFSAINDWATLTQGLSTFGLLAWYSEHVEKKPEYLNAAIAHVNYALGDNSLNRSFVIGYGNNYPKRVHHRGSAGNAGANEDNRNLLVGALVGGQSLDGKYEDKRDDYVRNEMGISYNASFILGLLPVLNSYLSK